MSKWAQDFYEIQNAVGENAKLQSKIVELVNNEPIHGKAIEGGDRIEALRNILISFFEGQTELEEAFRRVSSELPRQESPYARNNRVFADGWDKRMVRTQASRFYNQATLLILKEHGDQTCFIPHSSQEKADSACTNKLAGNNAEIDILLDRLERTYGQADYHNEVKVPNHPHCTHTIVPSS